jgi:hypothetical protein
VKVEGQHMRALNPKLRWGSTGQNGEKRAAPIRTIPKRRAQGERVTLHERMSSAGIVALLGLLALTGCSSEPAPPTPPATTPARLTTSGPTATGIKPLPTGGRVDYQLGAAYPVPPGTTIVARDSTEAPEPDVYSICYINGFQSQPGDTSTWLERHPDLVLKAGGRPVIDPNWPDEILFDTTSSERRDAILEILQPTLERCAKSGFDAVEIDNLDSFTRSGGAISADDNIALASAYASRAHALGLAIGQKNTGEFSARLHDSVGFDFAVAEECHRFDECQLYRAVYGETVIDIEYADDLRGTFAEACADPESPRAMVLRDRRLVAATDAGYVYQHC